MVQKKKLYIETYGCQMNFSDSEIVASVLAETHETTNDVKEADLIFINTCSIRDNAEDRVWKRLIQLGYMKRKNKNLKVGILGCMAERLKEKLLEQQAAVDLVVGPDAYRNLPKLLNEVGSGQNAINVILSEEETYADISPVRYDSNGVSAYISIMRGCENFCSYCVVPYTRGKERSRDPQTIVNETNRLFEEGYREVTLLGQNVNSYRWQIDNSMVDFPKLLEMVAIVNPQLRVRFATSHPKDLSDDLLYTIAKYPNLCKSIHLPVQSGSDNMLLKMNRKYTRTWYLDRIAAIKRILPDASISTDTISGFCSETEADHQETLSMMEHVGYDFAYMFKYSERPDTAASKRFPDDIPEEVKARRLQEIIDLQSKLSLQQNKKDVGKIVEVLVEGVSKRSKEHFSGRNSQNKVVVFPKENYKIGDYATVYIYECTGGTLKGRTL
ncbi:MAG: tRNA (N6-isopentenyl adenosine(37)-C2)-methylthiotransferase MiaB [Bacteroidota bacterium]